MKKALILSFILLFALFAASSAIAHDEGITSSDLGVSAVRAFRAFKELWLGVRLRLTADPVKKASLELELLSSKSADVLTSQPERLGEAIKNYETAQERLKKMMEELKETSQNPNVDKLIQKLADRVVKHVEVFDEVLEKVKRDQEDTDAIRAVRTSVMEMLAKAGLKDDPEKFALKIKKAYQNLKGGFEKGIGFLEVLDQIKKDALPATSKALDLLKEKVSAGFATELKDFFKEGEKVQCQTAGCSGELCLSEEEVKDGGGVSICLFKPEYDCYKTARCELQSDGKCGWSQTEDLKSCIEHAQSAIQ